MTIVRTARLSGTLKMNYICLPERGGYLYAWFETISTSSTPAFCRLVNDPIPKDNPNILGLVNFVDWRQSVYYLSNKHPEANLHQLSKIL